jgi:hypothetical protein
MADLTDEQREAYEQLAAAIDRVARTALDGVCLKDDELIGDFVICAHVMSVGLLHAGEGRYLTVLPNGHIPSHSVSGLLKIGMEISESTWIIGDEDD